MRTVSLLAVVLAVTGCASDPVETEETRLEDAARAEGSRAADPADVTGYYRLDRSDDEGCKLLAQQATPAAGTADSVRVLLDCWIGPPSHNQGSIDAVVALADGEAVYPGAECTLRFAFASDGATVTQDGTACGFGAGVRAAGDFRRLSGTPPVFYVPGIDTGTQPGIDPVEN